MYQKNTKVYSKPNSYLIKKDTNIRSLVGIGNLEDFIELEFKLPYEFKVINTVIVNLEGINFRIGNYEVIKTNIIKSRYTNDDQIAIMLNKDNSAADKLAFTRMQEWREWSSKLAKAIVSFSENKNHN